MSPQGGSSKEATSTKENSGANKTGDDDTVAVIPLKFLNSLGFINYDQYGNFPWSCDETAEIFLSREYKSITNFLGIDCEMVGVGHFKVSALGRVSIVNEHGYCIYDTFVNPVVEVTDYRTKFSGIRAEDLERAPSLDVVLKEVAHLVKGKTLVGHSIHNDLDVLKLNGCITFRDTSVYFKKLSKQKSTPSLKTLAKDYLNTDIQTGEHSSIQDAQATIKLYLLCREEWERSFSQWRSKANIDIEKETLTEISDMHVEPREPDLFVESQTVFVRANKVVGAYSSCEEYLDIQFRLLLEDFLRPLREAVRTVNWRRKTKLVNKKSEVMQSVRISGKGSFEVKGKGTILVPIEKNDLKDWEEFGMFMTGSLLLLSHDNFKSVKFAIVSFVRPENENEDRESNYYLPINVFFTKDGPSWMVNDSDRFSMMESKAFYAAYKYTLEYLQIVDMNTFPMKKYIVDAETKSVAPSHLEFATETIEFSILMKDGSSKKAKPFELHDWPKVDQLELDSSQYGALKKALTQELTIIQGPPGTGKTYTSLQLVKMLLTNEWLCQGSPVLIVSYTNHSLDQILELILEFVTTVLFQGNEKKAQKSILRIGGGSKSEIIEPLTLKYKGDKVREKKKLQKNMDKYQKPLGKLDGLDFKIWLLDMGILNFKSLPQSVLKQLESNAQCKKMLGIWNAAENTIRQNPCAWFSLEKKSVKSHKQREGLFLLPCKNLETLLCKHLPMIIKMVKNNNMLSEDLYLLRWAFYFFLVDKIKTIVEEMKDTLFSLQQQFAKFEHYEIKSQVLKSAKIVGMTTTGAVKFKSMVQKSFKPKIMIVEEAAHVLEAHVVASLTEHCQQMILIGDHKQLRPLTADNDLGEKYQLNISLMERLVQNGVAQSRQNWIQLKKQHRMRPEIARMVCPVIYEELENHPMVFTYPHVRGCDKNLFFVDHQHPDKKEKGSRSYFNQHEANFVVDMLTYFIVKRNYYKPTQITVIVAYLAQKNLLDKMLQYEQHFKDVRVSTIDGYQGEENDIILLSLVRSNTEKNVGFLKTDNRVCVALSRARHGLFMIGNITCLEPSSDTWKKINEILKGMKSIGTRLPLNSRWEPKKGLESESDRAINTPKNSQPPPTNSAARNEFTKEVSVPTLQTKASKDVLITLDCGHKRLFTPNQLSKADSLGILPNCMLVVQKSLPCGHMKSMQCQQFKTYVCGRQKITRLKCGHEHEISCSKNLSQFKCVTNVMKDLPCGHQQNSQCYQNPSIVKCNVCRLAKKDAPENALPLPITTAPILYIKLPCGHAPVMLTSQPPISISNSVKVECVVAVTKNLSCGHAVTVQCCKLETYECQVQKKVVLTCGHENEVPCSKDISKIKCIVTELKALPCGHHQNSHCHQIPSTIPCGFCAAKKLVASKEKIASKNPDLTPTPNDSSKKLPCGHSPVLPPNPLTGAKSKAKCVVVITKNLSCGHTVKLQCNKSEIHKCVKMSVRLLNCGHRQNVPCSKKPSKVKCITVLPKKLPCGHQQKSPCHQSPSDIKCSVCGTRYCDRIRNLTQSMKNLNISSQK